MTGELNERLAETLAELEELRAENARLRGLLGLDDRLSVEPGVPTAVDARSPPEAKLALYRSLFIGRDDVYALRWEHTRTGKAGWSPAVQGGWAGRSQTGKEPRQNLPLTDEVVIGHLTGKQTVGLYPLLRGDGCRLVACDFDGGTWALDALAYLNACSAAGVPAALERSRSGDGAHVWVFFSGPVPASAARALGTGMLREAMAARAELDLASYDRFFPAQDFAPKGSFGNLIALPLQGGCRRRGTTVFLDPATLAPWPDQWAFLSGLEQLSPEAVAGLVDALRPIEAGPGAKHLMSGRDAGRPAPPQIRAELGAMLAIERFGLPPALVSALKHLAALHNPDFYKRQRLRRSTWNTPRLVRCYQETIDRLMLPRGLLASVEQLLAEAGSNLVIADQRPAPGPVRFRLTATLTALQQAAVDDLAGHDHGMLAAPPGTGKTVIACALIARHAQPTLVIVDRTPLLDQWRARLRDHLGLAGTQIGQLGAGRDRRCGIVDLAMAQSLGRREDVEAITAGYGLVVVDECHHIPAATFEECVRRITVRRWIGLTATPYRSDGLEAIIAMHCGPIRHQIAPKDAPGATLRLELVVHDTHHQAQADAEERSIQEVFRALVEDHQRTASICRDVVDALDRGRNCLVLTQWAEHMEHLRDQLHARGRDPLVLKGGMGKKARAAVLDALSAPDRQGGLLLVATGSYLGEGFDCPWLDTLFLAFPLAFKGRLVQYVGRVLRTAEHKDSVEVHDYVDHHVPVLDRMHAKRLPAFASLGFDTPPRRHRR